MKTQNTLFTKNRFSKTMHLLFSAGLSAILMSIANPAFSILKYKAASGSTATNIAFSALPPLSAAQPVDPNVIVSFDNSASMLLPAYDNAAAGWKKTATTHADFDSTKKYYGYFENAKYRYEGPLSSPASTNNWFIKDAAGGWDGNFLNWVTMRRVDVARKVLIGGKVRRKHTDGDPYDSPRQLVSGNWVLEAESDQSDSDRDTFVKVQDAAVTTASEYTPYNENANIWVKQGTIYIDVDGNNDWSDGVSYNVHIALNTSTYSEPTGFLQNNKDEFRIGAAVFNYDHTRPIDGTDLGIYRGNTITDGGTLYPCFPDLSQTTPTNYDVCLPTHVKAPIDNIVRVIEEYPLVWGTTAIAETMYEIYGYVSQTDHGINHPTGSPQTPAGPYFFPNGQDKTLGKPSYEISNDWDPYYYTEYTSKVDCCKVYVININDGGSWNDWDDAATEMPAELTTGAIGIDVDGDSDPAATDTGDSANTQFVDDLALYLRKTDIRDNTNGIGLDDLPGHQEIFNYFIFAALGGASAAEIQKMKESAVNGAFIDLDGDHLPDPAHVADFATYTTCTANEWDADADCIPDGFFNADSGGALVLALTNTFASIRKQVSSGTSAAVLANSTDGIGTIYHSLYQPTSKDIDDRVINWGGILNALFIDNNGYIREDNLTDGTRFTLDGYAQDRIIDIYYDPVLQETLIQRYNAVDGAGNKIADGPPVNLSQLNSIWEAREQLSSVTYSDTNRSYTAAAQTGRHILTSIDNELRPFEASVFALSEPTPYTNPSITDTFTLPLYNLLGLVPATETLAGGTGITAATKIINYVRGKESITGFRNRTIKFGTNTTAKPWLLGDIIHSTPAVVAAPDEDYDLLYGDKTYAAFKEKYLNRRQMVYVGANDGMLHAFNGGFFNSSTKTYEATPTGLTDHSLGSEVWAYIPFNLLPHLQWLASPNYEHTYYVDGAPFIFDARIYDPTLADTDTHPKGWATLMAVTMRLGGAPFKVDLEEDGTDETVTNTDADNTDDVTFQSSIAIFDITDPEVAPILLRERTLPYMGFTTSKPDIIMQHLPNATAFTYDDPAKNNWYLAMGSGPDDLDTASRTDAVSAGLYILNLNDLENNNLPGSLYTTGDLNHFVGDTQVVDWVTDGDYDTLYFGTVGNTSVPATNTNRGKLYRLDLGTITNAVPTANGWGTPVQVITSTTMAGGVGQPFANRPIEAFDIKGNPWIYVGSGRLFTAADATTVKEQSFYGVKEILDPTTKLPTSAPATSSAGGTPDLQDVSGVRVFANNSILDPKNVIAGTQPDTITPATVDTFTELEASIDAQRGWVINFEPLPNSGAIPSTRNTSAAAFYSQLTLFSSFTPGASNDVCNVLGNSSLYIVYGRTGTAYPNVGLGNQACPGCITGDPDETLSSINVGAGQAAETIIHRGTAITNLGTGAISTESVIGVPIQTGRQSWQEINELPAIAK